MRRSADLLEKHHSRPNYQKVRILVKRMSSWKGQSGQLYGYWGGSRRSGKPKGAQQDKGKGKSDKGAKPDKKEQEKEEKLFPSYDTMVVQSQPSSSATPSMDEQWQQMFQGLMAANPSLKVPQELERMIQGTKREETKKEMYDQQKALNMKRKAAVKLERMQQALKRKHFQMEAYREQIRNQLQAEVKRYATETAELEKDIAKQKEVVERLEHGIVKEEDENMGLFVDVPEESLSTLLGLTDDKDSADRIAQLQKEKQEALMVAQKMQERLQMMIAGGPMPHLGRDATSPQMPLEGRKRPKLGDGVEFIPDSPKEGMTGMD